MTSWRPNDRPSRWLQWIPAWLRGSIGLALRLGIFAAILGGGVIFYYVSLANRFDMAEVGRMPAGILLFDNEGREMGAAGFNGRRLVTREEIPNFMVRALQAREDARFFEHCGIDFRGLARATLRNVKDRDFTQGASTLSMQLARNSFEMRAKSLHRKFLELALTLRVEKSYSKDQILTHYLNRIYFGSGCEGIEQAARTYFGKPTKDLNEGECAMLIGIIRGPHIFSPFRNFEAATEQRNQVLNRMVMGGFINEAEKERVKNLPIELVPEEKRQSERSYYFQAVRSELDRIIDDEQLRQSGLKVYTTIDLDWQVRLETEAEATVDQLEREKGWKHPTHEQHESGTTKYLQFAALTLETKTGAILALIGGRDYLDSRYDRTLGARRDLGRAIEPFVAAAAAEKGKLVLPGKPVPTGRQVGPAAVERTARKCGLNGPFVQTEDLFRGAAAATPMEVSIGLATIGNNGKRPLPFLIRRITDNQGTVLYEAKPHLTNAISAEAARETMRAFDKTGGTRCLTGATGSERDAWMLRLGPGGATTLWLGFDQPTAITSEARLRGVLDEFVSRLKND